MESGQDLEAEYDENTGMEPDHEDEQEELEEGLSSSSSELEEGDTLPTQDGHSDPERCGGEGNSEEGKGGEEISEEEGGGEGMGGPVAIYVHSATPDPEPSVERAPPYEVQCALCCQWCVSCELTSCLAGLVSRGLPHASCSPHSQTTLLFFCLSFPISLSVPLIVSLC